MRIFVVFLLGLYGGAAFAVPCNDVFESNLTRTLSDKSPNFKSILHEARGEFLKLPKMVQRRVAKEVGRAKFIRLERTLGGVNAKHSVAQFIVEHIATNSDIFEATVISHSSTTPPAGLFFNSRIRGHPLMEIVFLHEFSHMKRAYNRLGFDSSRFYLRRVLDKSGVLNEERLAIGDEYDGIRKFYSLGQLPQLREQYPFPKDIVAIEEESAPTERELIDLYNDHYNKIFIGLVESALTKTKEQYISDKLKYYEDSQQSRNGYRSKILSSAVDYSLRLGFSLGLTGAILYFING